MVGNYCAISPHFMGNQHEQLFAFEIPLKPQLQLSAAPIQACESEKTTLKVLKSLLNLRKLNAKTNYYRGAASYSCGF